MVNNQCDSQTIKQGQTKVADRFGFAKSEVHTYGGKGHAMVINGVQRQMGALEPGNKAVTVSLWAKLFNTTLASATIPLWWSKTIALGW